MTTKSGKVMTCVNYPFPRLRKAVRAVEKAFVEKKKLMLDSSIAATGVTGADGGSLVMVVKVLTKLFSLLVEKFD